MKAKLSKRSFKWLMLSTLIPATLASACSDNTPQANNKNTSSDTKSGTDQNLPNADQNLPNADQPAQDLSSKLISTTPLAEELKLQETRFDDLSQITNLVEINKGQSPKQKASVFWKGYQNKLNDLVNLLQFESEITKKYQIEVLSDSMTLADDETGTISDLLVIFKKDHQFQPVRFYLSGFQSDSIEQLKADPKFTYLTQIKDLSAGIKGLYPSFLALMLYYADNSEYPESQHSARAHKLGYYDFLNHNTEYFTDQSISFNQSLLHKLFQFGAGNYHVKVVGIKFSDLEGTLSLKMRISDDANPPKQIERTFEFDGLRQLEPNKSSDSVLSVTLPIEGFKQLVLSNQALQKVLKANMNSSDNFDVFSKWEGTAQDLQKTQLTQQLFNRLAGKITDTTKNIYKNTDSDFPLSTLIGVSANAGIYPFYTTYSASSTISSLTLNVTKASTENNNNKNLTVSFKVSLPITVVDSYTTINDIYSSNSESLDFNINVSVPLSSILTSSK